MKIDPLRSLKKHHGKKLLVDANLLLPYFQGCFYRVFSDVPRHASFKEPEFTLLAQIIQHFSKTGKIISTPHLLTEVSNVSEGLKENHPAFLDFIRPLIQKLDEQFEERKIGSSRLAEQEYFPRFGLADAVIIRLAYDPLLILTNDKRMARYLQEEKKKRNVIYFGDLVKECLS